VDPWKSDTDEWLEKTGRIPTGIQIEDGKHEAMAAGLLIEPGRLAWAETKLGPLVRNQYRSVPALHLGVNCDAIVKSSKRPVEAKTGGLFGALSKDWGEFNTAEVPTHVIVQAHGQMIATESDLCHVPVLLGGRGRGMYEIPRDEGMITLLTDALPKWWDEHVVKDIPPSGSPSIDVARRIRKIPNKIVNIDPTAVLWWEAMKKLKKWAEAEVDRHAADILLALDGAETANFDADLAEDWDSSLEQVANFLDFFAETNAEGITNISDDIPGNASAVSELIDLNKQLTNFIQKRAGYVVKDTEFRQLRYKKVEA
jgi:hypothetical protein